MFRMAFFVVVLKNYLILFSPLYLGSSDINMLDVFSVPKELYCYSHKKIVFKFR